MNRRNGIIAIVIGGAISLASPFLLSFLGKWEGEGEYVVYADKLAGGLPTVCKGITRWTSPYPVIVGERWTPEKCEEVETHVTVQTQMKLAECITNSHITQGVFDALTSHAHNVGVNNTCGSRAVRLINAGDIRGGCDAIAHSATGRPVWSYVGTTFVRGLYNRRLDERKLCLEGL